MGDGRDGLPEAVHLSAEKARMARRISTLTEALQAIAWHPHVEAVADDGVRSIDYEWEALQMRLIAEGALGLRT